MYRTEKQFILVCMLHLELGLLKAYRKRKDYRTKIEDLEKLDDDVIKQHLHFITTTDIFL